MEEHRSSESDKMDTEEEDKQDTQFLGFASKQMGSESESEGNFQGWAASKKQTMKSWGYVYTSNGRKNGKQRLFQRQNYNKVSQKLICKKEKILKAKSSKKGGVSKKFSHN